jgi:hypothetical protein
MWILKNSKELSANVQAQNFSQIDSIKNRTTFGHFIFTIPPKKIKSRLFDIIHVDSCFFNKTGKRKYQYLVISHQKHYFVKYYCDSTRKYSEVEIRKMLESFIDNIFVVVSQVIQQPVRISMGTNCAPLLEDQ